MKKTLKIIVVLIFVAFAGIQFMRPSRENPPIIPEQTLQATMQVPEEVEKIFQKSCNDCHTNQTNWRWYSEIAPISWQMVDHVNDGRRHLNFSEWTTYETRRKRKKLEEICEQVQSKEMPLDQYVWIHGEAKLNDAEIKTLCDWTEIERARLENSEPK